MKPTLPTNRGQKSTLQDVAKAAGVSLSTASKALNSQGKLKLATRERVWQEAHRLNFHSQILRQRLDSTFTIGLLTHDVEGRLSLPLLRGIEDVIGPKPFTVFLCTAVTRQQEQQHFEALVAKQVDGIVVMSDKTNLRPSLITTSNVALPIIYAYSYVSDPNVISLLPDDEQGGRLAVEHLIGIGRRRLAHITGPLFYEAVQLRARAMREVLHSHNLELSDLLMLSGPWEESWGYEAANILLEREPTIDGIFCGNDKLARGAIEALREKGINIPKDIAIVGYDNWEDIAYGSRPTITTVDMNLKELGQVIGQRFLKILLDGDQQVGITRLPCKLIIRNSSFSQ